MRLTGRWIAIVSLATLCACGDADSPPSEPDPVDTASTDEPADTSATTSEEDPDIWRPSGKADRIMHTRVPGDLVTRDTCETMCRQKDLFCDPEYHSFRGTGGGLATWLTVNEMLRCDESPSETKRDAAGNVWELSDYECYCMPL